MWLKHAILAMHLAHHVTMPLIANGARLGTCTMMRLSNALSCHCRTHLFNVLLELSRTQICPCVESVVHFAKLALMQLRAPNVFHLTVSLMVYAIKTDCAPLDSDTKIIMAVSHVLLIAKLVQVQLHVLPAQTPTS